MVEASAEEALKLEELAERVPGERAHLLTEAADEWALVGDVQRAERLYGMAISDGGSVRGDARTRYARFLFDQDAPSRASEVLNELWAAHPQDLFVYQSAGELLEDHRDDAGAIRWFTGGVARCVGLFVDVDRLADYAGLSDLLEARARLRRYSSLEPDTWDLTWFEHYERTNPGRRADKLWTAEHITELTQEVARLRDENEILKSWRPGYLPFVVPYWPSVEFEQAAAAFPGAFAELTGAAEPHLAHRRAVEAELRAAGPALDLAVTPLSVSFVQKYARYTGVEADSAEAHQRFAALGNIDGRGISWPPGRNDPCWCGSERKYKKCCGAPGFTTDKG